MKFSHHILWIFGKRCWNAWRRLVLHLPTFLESVVFCTLMSNRSSLDLGPKKGSLIFPCTIRIMTQCGRGVQCSSKTPQPDSCKHLSSAARDIEGSTDFSKAEESEVAFPENNLCYTTLLHRSSSETGGKREARAPRWHDAKAHPPSDPHPKVPHVLGTLEGRHQGRHEQRHPIRADSIYRLASHFRKNSSPLALPMCSGTSSLGSWGALSSKAARTAALT